jgi:fermentation-respiration switch protein FrsA (DUF1100 family)
VPVALVHGIADDRVPVAMSREYAARAAAAGDYVELVELPDTDHFAVIDPLSAVWPRIVDVIERIGGASAERMGQGEGDRHGHR